MGDYAKAWQKFTESVAFSRLMDQMRSGKVPADMYLENRIRCAFDAGWAAASELQAERLTDAGHEGRGQEE